jgi:hypothetical protein
VIVVIIWSVSFIGKGASNVVRGLGRDARLRRDAAATALANEQLLPGERLLCVDRQREQPVISACFVVLGILCCFLWMWFFFTTDELAGKWICILFFVPSLFFIHMGLFCMFKQTNNYFFVTDRRLGLRGIAIFGKQINRNIPGNMIRKVEVIDYRVNGEHINYRVHVTIDIGKRKPQVTIIIPEHDPAIIANAANSIKETIVAPQHREVDVTVP